MANWCIPNFPETQKCGPAIATSISVHFKERTWGKGSLVPGVIELEGEEERNHTYDF